MKSIFLLLFLLQVGIDPVRAQTITYPLTVTLLFGPSSDHSTLLRYEMDISGPGTPLSTVQIPLTSCPVPVTTTTICRHTFTIANAGPWNISLFSFGNSTWINPRGPASNTVFQVNQPAPATIIQVVLGK